MLGNLSHFLLAYPHQTYTLIRPKSLYLNMYFRKSLKSYMFYWFSRWWHLNMVVVFPQYRPSWSIYMHLFNIQRSPSWHLLNLLSWFHLTLSGFLWVGMERSMLLRTLRSVGQSKWLFTGLKSRRRCSCWCPRCRGREPKSSSSTSLGQELCSTVLVPR